MDSAISDIYYGNHTPSERTFQRDGEYGRILRLATQLEASLTGALTEEQKQQFEQFKEYQADMALRSELSVFTIGFKLGLRLAVEAYTQGTEEQAPI